MSDSARCASGARSPLAPTLPCSGIGGQSPAFSIATSVSASTARAPEYPFAMHVRAEQHHRARLALGEQRPDAGRVAAHEVDLQLGEPVAAGSRSRTACRSRSSRRTRRRRSRRARRRSRSPAPCARAPTGASSTGARRTATATTSSSVSECPSRTTAVGMRAMSAAREDNSRARARYRMPPSPSLRYVALW